jgi:galactose mutarotase-like enzyme
LRRSPTAPIEGTLAGWRAVTLTGERLEVVVLPERGAEIHALRDRRTGIDVLLHAPWGLAPPGAPPREGADGHGFLERYAGGWQELFPSVNDPTTYAGAAIPFHGEVALLPWEVESDGDALVCRVACRATPFDLERRMRLDGDALILDEAVTNRSDREAHFVWGHHCVLGPPFLERACRLDAPARTVVTIPEMWEDTARLEPGQRSAWPHARLRAGGTADLREVPGPEAGSHDDVYLTDLDDGYVAVTNPRLGLTFRLEFDRRVFRWLISWQPYGGAEAMPLAGAYALGIEPWITHAPLGDAARAGEAIALGGGERFRTQLRARVQGGDAWQE